MKIIIYSEAILIFLLCSGVDLIQLKNYFGSSNEFIKSIYRDYKPNYPNERKFVNNAVQKELHDKHIFTHVEWHMVCYYLVCETENDLFTWVDNIMLESEIALPTAFKRFSPDSHQ